MLVLHCCNGLVTFSADEMIRDIKLLLHMYHSVAIILYIQHITHF